MNPDAETAYRFLTEKPAQYGKMLGYENLRDDLHGKWIREMVLGHDDMTLQAHRGSYKTTSTCIALAICVLLRGDFNHIILRKTDTDIQEVINIIRRIIFHDTTQAIYKMLTGQQLTIIKSTSTEITTSTFVAPRGAAQVLGIGTGGSITGKHADRMWTDDIVNLQDRKSHAERERTKSIYQELQNIKNPGGRIINTGTPWHKDDAFILMPRPEKYDCYNTGLLSSSQIEKLRSSMSPSLFAANYELQHIASEHALFSTMPHFTSDVELIRDGIAHVDAGYGGDDYTAFTCGKRDGDKLYMYGRMWHKHVDTLIDPIIEESKRLRCGPIWCEDNGDKGFLAKEFIRSGYKSVIYHEHENKYIKISTWLRKWWDDIVWLEGTDRDYITQVLDFTEDAEHDDAPDSAAVVCRILNGKRGKPYKSPFGG